MMLSRVALVALLLLAVAFPGAHAKSSAGESGDGLNNPTEPANVTLFYHINGFQEFPINTQPPADWYNQNAGIGITTSSMSCGGLTSGTPADREYHTSYGYSSPGYVEYNYTPDGVPRTHPERGLSYDIQFDGDGFNLYWYLSTQTGLPKQPQGDPNTAPVVVPNVIVKATLRTGERITIDKSGYNEGDIVAQGQTAPATLAMQATTGARWVQVEGLNVYELVVPMTLQTKAIPKEGGFSLRVDTFMDNPQCNDPSNGYLMPNLLRVHTSMELRPRMDVRIFVPIRVEYLHPQFLYEDLAIHTAVNSPWGNYDVDETAGGIELTITGPTKAGGRDPGTCALQEREKGCFRAAVVQRYHDHDHHTEAVDVAYLWHFKKDLAPDGEYVIELKVYNDQRTSFATATSSFTIGPVLKVVKCGGLNSTAGAQGNEKCVDEVQNPDGSHGTVEPAASPGLQTLAVLATLGAGAVFRRRT